MYLRSLRRSASGKPSTSRRRLRNAAWSCSLSRMRMTASSPCIDGMIETRKSIVRPLHAQPEAPVLRHPLLGDVELRHHLEAADDRVVVPLVERLERGVEHAVDPVLGEDLAVLRLDVDVGGAAVDGAEDERVDEAHDRALARAAASPRPWPLSSSATSCRRSPSLACSSRSSPPRWRRSERRHAVRGGEHRLDRPLQQELELVDLRRGRRATAKARTMPLALAPHAARSA